MPPTPDEKPRPAGNLACEILFDLEGIESVGENGKAAIFPASSNVFGIGGTARFVRSAAIGAIHSAKSGQPALAVSVQSPGRLCARQGIVLEPFQHPFGLLHGRVQAQGLFGHGFGGGTIPGQERGITALVGVQGVCGRFWTAGAAGVASTNPSGGASSRNPSGGASSIRVRTIYFCPNFFLPRRCWPE